MCSFGLSSTIVIPTRTVGPRGMKRVEPSAGVGRDGIRRLPGLGEPGHAMDGRGAAGVCSVEAVEQLAAVAEDARWSIIDEHYGRQQCGLRDSSGLPGEAASRANSRCDTARA